VDICNEIYHDLSDLSIKSPVLGFLPFVFAEMGNRPPRQFHFLLGTAGPERAMKGKSMSSLHLIVLSPTWLLLH